MYYIILYIILYMCVLGHRVDGGAPAGKDNDASIL